jgi:hypothetical protein
MAEKPLVVALSAAAAAPGIAGTGEWWCYTLLASEVLAITRSDKLYPVKDREETQGIENQPLPEHPVYFLARRVSLFQ